MIGASAYLTVSHFLKPLPKFSYRTHVVSQETIIRLLAAKGIITKEELLELVEVVNLEMAEMV